ncbi:MAG TPA: hypothetical protein VGC77_12725 [Rhodopseudomonas sp.]|uniref:hypothetical protein n=1 Tax=Rhodopseudomonas sp. TaxID=1078 RepID=UPI002EDAD842
MKAKNTTAAPRSTPDHPKIPVPAFGGMNAPSGLPAVTQFAELTIGAAQTRKIAITVSRDGGGHLGVAQAGKGAGEGAEHERQQHRGARIGGGGVAGQNEDAGPDDAADPERNKIERRERPLEMAAVRVHLGDSRLRAKIAQRLANPYISHRRLLAMEPVAGRQAPRRQSSSLDQRRPIRQGVAGVSSRPGDVLRQPAGC